MNFPEQLQAYQSEIEQYLENSCLLSDGQPQKLLYDAMRYSLLAGGKRLRPVLTYDFCRMCGRDWKKASDFGAAVEMIHTYSLIHDDLPCMDNDDFRRGKPTNHKVYGEAMAVLAGDALLTTAFSSIAGAEFDAETRIRAVKVLSSYAGETGMVGGQVLDILSEERKCTEQEVLDIQSRKTGALIKAACQLGVLAGGGTQEQMDAADRIAHHLGLAFQIRDDMLDVIGDAKELGKATGVDTQKNTFVVLYGLQKCEELVNKHTELAICALSAFDNAEFMKILSKYLINRTF